MLLERKLQQFAGQPVLLENATPGKRNLERARQWVIDRSKRGGSGGKPPTVGGQPLVDWSRQPSITTTAPAVISIAEAVEAFRAHADGFRLEAARVVKPLVKNGMTKREVEELLGPPNSKTHEGSNWHYDVFYSQAITVQFDHSDLVSSVRSTFDDDD